MRKYYCLSLTNLYSPSMDSNPLISDVRKPIRPFTIVIWSQDLLSKSLQWLYSKLQSVQVQRAHRTNLGKSPQTNDKPRLSLSNLLFLPPISLVWELGHLMILIHCIFCPAKRNMKGLITRIRRLRKALMAKKRQCHSVNSRRISSIIWRSGEL